MARLKSIIIIATMAVLFTTTIACNLGSGLPTLPSGYVWYHNDEYGYSVGYPEDWTIMEETEEGTVTISESVTGPQLNVGVDTIPSSGSLESYLNTVRQGVELSGAMITSEKEIVVNGQEGYELVLLQGWNNISIRQRAAIFIAGGTAYYVVCTSTADSYDSYKDTFDNIINSTVVGR